MENDTSVAKLKIIYLSNNESKSNRLSYELKNIFSK